jgi:DNA ligase-associated metallophosphoesterase
MAAPFYHTIQNNTFWLLPQRALFWEEQKALIVSDLHLGKTGHFRKEGIAVPQGVYKDDLHRLFHIIQHYKPEQLIIAGDMFHSRMNKEVDLFTRWRKDVSHLHIQLIKGNHDILADDHYTTAGITISNQFLHIGSFCFVHDIGDAKGEVRKTERPEDRKMERQEVRRTGRLEDGKSGRPEDWKTERHEYPIDGNLQSKIASLQSKIGNWKPETCIPDRQAGNQEPYYFSGHVHPGIVLKTGSRQSLRFPCYYFTLGYAVLPAFSAFSGLYSVSPKKNEKVFAIVNGEVMRMGVG